MNMLKPRWNLSKIPTEKLNTIASELAFILDIDPENDEALQYRRYVDSELKTRVNIDPLDDDWNNA